MLIQFTFDSGVRVEIRDRQIGIMLHTGVDQQIWTLTPGRPRGPGLISRPGASSSACGQLHAGGRGAAHARHAGHMRWGVRVVQLGASARTQRGLAGRGGWPGSCIWGSWSYEGAPSPRPPHFASCRPPRRCTAPQPLRAAVARAPPGVKWHAGPLHSTK